jgi:hypothetical protein
MSSSARRWRATAARRDRRRRGVPAVGRVVVHHRLGAGRRRRAHPRDDEDRGPSRVEGSPMLRSLALVAAVAATVASPRRSPGRAPGSITGTVTWKGEAPAAKPVDRSSDPVCAATARGKDDVLVTDGKLRDVVVRITAAGGRARDRADDAGGDRPERVHVRAAGVGRDRRPVARGPQPRQHVPQRARQPPREGAVEPRPAQGRAADRPRPQGRRGRRGDLAPLRRAPVDGRVGRRVGSRGVRGHRRRRRVHAARPRPRHVHRRGVAPDAGQEDREGEGQEGQAHQARFTFAAPSSTTPAACRATSATSCARSTWASSTARR